MIVGESNNKKILFFQEISKRIHLHPNCEKIKFLGQFGVRSALRVMPPLKLGLSMLVDTNFNKQYSGIRDSKPHSDEDLGLYTIT